MSSNEVYMATMRYLSSFNSENDIYAYGGKTP